MLMEWKTFSFLTKMKYFMDVLSSMTRCNHIWYLSFPFLSKLIFRYIFTIMHQKENRQPCQRWYINSGFKLKIRCWNITQAHFNKCATMLSALETVSIFQKDIQRSIIISSVNLKFIWRNFTYNMSAMF